MLIASTSTHRVADLHEIADEILVLEQNEESRDQVGDEVLCAQADRQTDHTGARQDRVVIDFEDAEHHQREPK